MGFNFILSRLTPASPYGAEKIKQMTFLTGAELEKSFNNIQIAINNAPALDGLCARLSALKNIRGSLAKKQLTQVDFFEVKQFLIVYEKLLHAFNNFSFRGIDLHPMDGALGIVDPKGLRITVFTVESPSLQIIRKEKLRIEAIDLLSDERYALAEREAAEENRVLKEMSNALQAHISLFLANLDNIGALDLTVAKAKLAMEYQAVRPKISRRGVLSYKNIVNPYVADALETQPLTPISLSIEKGVTVITGANMGGKSVAIKTVVLNTLLCRLGFFVFAEDAEVPLFDGIYLISEDMQDVKRGLSSFGAEITRVNEIANRAEKEFLFITLDEFARGTNPDEGAAIVRGLANYFSKSNCVCLIATHYNRVVMPMFKHYQVKGLKFVAQGAAYMDYNLMEAPHDAPPPKDALHICKLIGLKKDLLEAINVEYKII